MTSVINLTAFASARRTATLVLIDMHQNPSSAGRDPALGDAQPALENARLALSQGRSAGVPIAFVRQIDPAASLKQASRYPRWIEGFEPGRTDMVFDRQLPSCYASPEFADMMKHMGGDYVFAGLFGEGACLATAVDAFHRGHRFTYLADASASRVFEDISAADMHRASTHIVSLYGDVTTTELWVRNLSRKFRRG